MGTTACNVIHQTLSRIFFVGGSGLRDYLQPEPSEIEQRYSFNTHVHRSQESVAMYMAELKRIAEHCNFSDNARLNVMIRDRLVCGIANNKWKQHLLAEDPKKLNFDKVYSLLLSLEASEKQVKVLTQPEATQVHQAPPLPTELQPLCCQQKENSLA